MPARAGNSPSRSSTNMDWMADPGFERKPAPMAARIAGGLFVECIFTPLMWGTQKIGIAEKLMASVSDKRELEFVKKNPFRGYVPGPQDVFVMTYAKSGTNWMMQIVYQLIHHGEGEFDHIHNVVPWPDAKLVGGLMMGDYAIPLDQATEWQTAPERKRIIKTHFNWELLPYAEEARYISVIRDPKDVFVSAYFFMRDSGMGAAMPTVDTMYRSFVAGKFRGVLGAAMPTQRSGGFFCVDEARSGGNGAAGRRLPGHSRFGRNHHRGMREGFLPIHEGHRSQVWYRQDD